MLSGIIRGLVVALTCHLFTNACLAADFIDPLDRRPVPLGQTAQASRLTAIARAGSRLVAAGPRGLIVLSDDMGKTWRQVQAPSGSDLVAVHFRSARQGWIAGHDGVILHTADGGEHWSKQLDGTVAAAVIGQYYEHLASDGGVPDAQALREEAKRFKADGADKPFLDILFTSDTEGFAVGAFNLAMHTTDGGKSWTPLVDRTANPKALHLYALAVAGGELYLAGEQGMLRRWNKEGKRFEVVDTPASGSFFGLLGKGTTLYAFGLQGKAFRTRDRGVTWSRMQGTGNASLTAATLLPDGRIAFVSQGGKVLLTADDGETFSERISAHPMPYASVAISGERAISVVGSNGADTIALP